MEKKKRYREIPSSFLVEIPSRKCVLSDSPVQNGDACSVNTARVELLSTLQLAVQLTLQSSSLGNQSLENTMKIWQVYPVLWWFNNNYFETHSLVDFYANFRNSDVLRNYSFIIYVTWVARFFIPYTMILRFYCITVSIHSKVVPLDG